MKTLLLHVSLFCILVEMNAVAAPRSYTGTPISENFDGLGIAGTSIAALTGWDAGHFTPAIQQGTSGGNGVSTVTDPLTVDNGGHDPNSTPMLGNFGITSAADRALGSFARTTPAGDQFLQLAIKNDSGSPIESFVLSYRGEEWRSSATPVQQLSVWYGNTSATSGFVSMGSGFTFSSPNNSGGGQMDGNASGNFTAISGTYTPASPIAAGSTFYIRWYDINDSGIADDYLGIDDLTVTPALQISTVSAHDGDWHNPATWSPAMVPTSLSPVTVNGNAIRITSAAANCNTLTLAGGASVAVTGQALTVAGGTVAALNTTGGSLVLNGASTLNLVQANTSSGFAGLTVSSGAVLNITGELTVDASKDLSGATLNTPKVTLLGGSTLTASTGLGIGGGGLISGVGTVAGTVTVAGGGKASPGTDTTIDTITVSGLTLDSGSLLTLNAASMVSRDQLMVSGGGGLTLNGGAITLLNGTGTGPVVSLGTYNLIGYSGVIYGGGPSSLSVSNPVPGMRYHFDTSGGFVTLELVQGPLWSGANGGLWSVASNWSGAIPGAGDTLVYAAGGTSGSSVNDLTGASFPSIQFESGVSAFTLNGNGIILTGDIGGNVVLNNSSNTQTVNLPVTLGANGAINAASNPVVFGSAGTIDNNGGILTVKGAQPVTLGGAMTGSGGVMMGAGNLLYLGTDGAVSGTLTLSGGTIDNKKGSALTLTKNPAQVWGGNFTFAGTNDLNLGTGAVTLSAARTVTVNGSKTLTIGGPITGSGLSLSKDGSATGTLVVSSAGSSFGNLTVNQGTLRLDDSLTTSPAMTVTSTTVGGNLTLLDINNASLTTAGINIITGQVVVRGSSVVTNTGGARIGEYADSNSKSYYFKDTAIIHGGTGNLETHYTQAAQSVYILMRDSAQAAFANVIFGPNAEYADSTGHNTVLEVRDMAQLTIPGTGNMYVMQRINDQNRSNAGGARVHVQVYQHGGAVTVGGNLRLCDDDPVKGAATVKHEVDGAYNLGSGSNLKVGGIITGGATRTGVGQSYFNFHGGTLTYTGVVPQADWINLTASAVTDGINSSQNLRVWEGAVIDTGTQNVTVGQALLAATGSGVSAIDITGLSGTVYTNGCPPWVFITRDTASGDITGSGASAVATINGSGNITGFTITNPGNNYTVKPLITLIRGDMGTPGTVPAGNITMAANSGYTGGLTKKGSGTLTLTNTHTYAGATSVQNGTLSISTAYLADGADVKLYTGSLLNLNTSGATDTIRSLYINGVPQAAGIWGASDSGAANQSTLITGSGKLNVLTVGGILTYSISGKVVLNGAGLSGVTVSDGTRTATTDGSGNYIIADVPDAATYTVTPSLDGYAFTPPNAPVPVGGVNVSGTNFTATLAVGYAVWASANGASADPSADSNHDGVANGVAYFMNKTGLATQPGINGSTRKVTWPNGGKIPGAAYGTQFVVQISGDLQSWTNVPVGNLDANTDGPGGSLTYTLTGPSPRFVRLMVTPN